MRWLVSFLILSLFFFAPLKSNAGHVKGAKTARLTVDKNPKSSIIHYLISDDHIAFISSTEQRTSSTTRYRSFSHADFFPTDYLIKKIIPAAEIKYYAVPHLYCKAIGLKLLFPEHYFW